MKLFLSSRYAGSRKEIVIKNVKGRLSKETISRMVGDAEKYRDADEKVFTQLHDQMFRHMQR